MIRIARSEQRAQQVEHTLRALRDRRVRRGRTRARRASRPGRCERPRELRRPSRRAGTGRPASRGRGCRAAPRASRTDAVVQAQQPEPRDLVHLVVEEPDARDEVLDVRGFEELQSAVLDERDASSGELDLEQVAVVRGAHQHGLLAQRPARLGGSEHGVDHGARLGRRVMAAHEGRLRSARALGAQFEPLACRGRPHGVGRAQDRLPRAEVPLQADRARSRQLCGEVGQVPAVRAAEAVDRLRVVADDGQSDAVRAQVPDDVDLHLVDVLVLVDEDVVVAARPAPGRAHHRRAARASSAGCRRSRATSGRACASRRRGTVRARRPCAARPTGTAR